MSYNATQASEYSAQDAWLFYFTGPDFSYRWTNQPTDITATIAGVSTLFKHVRGGITANRPTESQDAARGGVEVRVAHDNPVIRKHREFPPHGDTELFIYHQNEENGVGTLWWSGLVFECPLEREDDDLVGVIRCKHVYEVISGSEGLTETFGPTCPWVLGQGGCPVSLANVTQQAEVTAVDIDLYTVDVTLDVGRDSDWFKLGVLVAQNGDKRTILEDGEVGTDKTFTLLQNFPETTLKVGDTVSVIWGDDLTHGTCSGKYAAYTGNGAAFGGNTLQKNTNPHVVGRLQ